MNVSFWVCLITVARLSALRKVNPGVLFRNPVIFSPYGRALGLFCAVWSSIIQFSVCTVEQRRRKDVFASGPVHITGINILPKLAVKSVWDWVALHTGVSLHAAVKQQCGHCGQCRKKRTFGWCFYDDGQCVLYISEGYYSNNLVLLSG